MKKYFYSFLAMIMAMMTITTLASCNSDDDDDYDNSPGVASKKIAYLKCPDDHHPHMIDLGLPSGTKWACCNVGAEKPEAYGGYYAWGETEVKSVYDWETYKHCDGTAKTCHDIGNDIAGSQYDVAHVKWGGSWVMPSIKQLSELYRVCTFEWTSLNGVSGGKYTGTNGGSIFLPAAGKMSGGSIYDVRYVANYWSSTRLLSSVEGAEYVPIESSGPRYNGNYARCDGRVVRPVSR